MASSQGDTLITKLDELRGKFGTYINKVEKNRRYYDLNFRNEVVQDISGNFTALIPPTATRAVDEAVDHILYTPKIKVPVRPTEEKQQEELRVAARKREFLKAWWHNIGLKYNPLGDGRKTLINEGRLVLKKTINWDVVPDKMTGKNARKRYERALKKAMKTGDLWKVEILDNVTVYEDPADHRNPAYVFIEYEVDTEAAKRMFPNAKGNWTKGNDYEPVKFREYWSTSEATVEPDKYVQWINDERVHDEENPYPYIPIAIDDAGFGTIRSTSKIEDKYVGMTEKTYPVFVAEAQTMTAWNEVLKVTAFPIAKARNMDSGKTITVGPGEILHVEGDEGAPGAEDLTFLAWPEIPLGVIQFTNKTNEIANSTLKMNVLGGQPQPGVETATEADQQIRNASSKLSGVVDALTRLAVKINSWVLMDIEIVLDIPITITGVSGEAEVHLSPQDIGGYYQTSVELSTIDEEAVNMVKARFWAEMYRVIPFLSAANVMVRGEMTDDPQEEMIMRDIEDMWLSEPMRQIRLLTGAESFKEFQAMLEQIAQAPPESELQGANSAESLFQTGETGGTEATPAGANQLGLFQESLQSRDTLQGPSQIRGPVIP